MRFTFIGMLHDYFREHYRSTYTLDPRGILLAPNVSMFLSDMDNGNNPRFHEAFGKLRLKHLTMNTSCGREDFVADACALLPLTHLTVKEFASFPGQIYQHALKHRIRSWNQGLPSCRQDAYFS